MNHDAYRPKDSIEIRRQSVAALQKAIETKFDEALFGNLIEDDVIVNKNQQTIHTAVVLVRSISGDVYKLLYKGFEDDKEFSIENYSVVGQAQNAITSGIAILDTTDKPGVLIEDHLSEKPRLISDAETIQYFTEIIDTSRLLNEDEKTEHRALVQKGLADILGIDADDTSQ